MPTINFWSVVQRPCIAGKAERTVGCYVAAVRRFAEVCGKPLAETKERSLCSYLADLTKMKVARGTHFIGPASTSPCLLCIPSLRD